MQNSYPFKFSEAHYVSIMPGAEPFEETFTGTVKLAIDDDDIDEILTLERNGEKVKLTSLPYNYETKKFEQRCFASARSIDWAKKQSERV